jgi:acetyl-CoA carboxylase biotin carboxyl carrier protein
VSGLSPEDIEALEQIFEATGWDRLDLIIGDAELHLSKSDMTTPPAPLPPPVESRQRTAPPQTTSQDIPAAEVRAPQTASSTGMLEIRAPHLGTFYQAPKPGAPPYVEVGQRVSADTEVCLLEVMKLFTTLRAGVSGTIRTICMADSSLVESGQVLFLVEPDR